ncbi:hypothetical protein VE02_05785 [Pseudogymnoascus sp. 03VT05]|nr:hypothetical protein VE02_05785 [Pseudogymnoascus sp. 03VT05]
MAPPSIAEDQAAMSTSDITVFVDVVPFGFRDPVKFNDYHGFDRLAYFLGLDNKAAVKTWMASNPFKPAYDELVRDWINSLWDKAVDGMRRVIDKTNFVEIDHYALCLVLLRAANETNPNGVFRGKNCTDENKDQRLWQAMLRGGAEAWYHRK